MLTETEIQQLIAICQLIGKLGLNNGVCAQIPKLVIDILQPPKDFTGACKNPAIFINKNTYQLLSRHHPNWIMNQTIAIKQSFLSQPRIEIIGAIIHEVGHAFNVAANIKNTETNAYIFEIEALDKLFTSKLELVDPISKKELKNYFESRLPYYKKALSTDIYLAKLVEKTCKQFNFNPNFYVLPIFKSGPNDFSRHMFFESKYKVENEIVISSQSLSN